ncbi:MAG: response regulator [Deltaproteobacteria bacterium]|nr:response regulator [Deltaproteobacteria bacterium]
MEQIQEQVRTKTPEILVMEDETSLAKGLRMILEKEGYHVDTASTGHSAMDALRNKGFDLLVADLRLPDMDGMDIIREVREKRPETKTIVITGYPSVSSAVDAMKLGVTDYLPKPFWDDEFKKAVEKALKGGKELYLKQEPDISYARKDVWPHRRAEQVAREESPGRPSVLIMEDEPSLAQGLKMVLSKQGYDVDLADTGLRALGSLGKMHYDLLVADLRLPDMDGMEVIKFVKEASPETQVVVITGYATVPTAVDSMKLGALDYLPKPFTMDEFIGAVGKATKAREEAAPAVSVAPPETEEERLIQRREVLRVLDRTSQDLHFWRDLMQAGSEVLTDYHLSSEAKAAIVSGDLRWINENVGELTQKQLMFIYKRLEREAW